MSQLANFLSWIIFGSAVGSLGYILEPKLRNGKAILLGIGGAVMSGIIAITMLNIPFEQFSLISLMISVGGATFLVMGNSLRRYL